VTIRFVEIAEAELDDAIQYYERDAPGLGEEFLAEVVLGGNRITEFPDAWQQLEAGLPRCRLNRFPYGLIYTQRGDTIVVLGVAHLAREPQEWWSRLGKRES